MKLPTLYKKTSTGAIQFWEISVDNMGFPGKDYPTIGEITTVYGQLGTDSPQTTVDTIRQGKNEGKKNATTALQQAEAEAKAKWEKQKKEKVMLSPGITAKQFLDERITAIYGSK